MAGDVETLLRTLLYEGYALFPYTEGAAKNATPTPFGIVYPPVYAAETPAAHDRLRLEGVVRGEAGAVVAAEVRFLVAAATAGHRAVEQRLALRPTSLAELAGAPSRSDFVCDGISGRLRLEARRLGPRLWRLSLCVHNTTVVVPRADRSRALGQSLLSTHPLLRVYGGAFDSPLERVGGPGRAVAGCACVNTYPVLATPDDDVLLGAAIVLPDHPELAPESRGDLFDGTEIEEALILHVLALSDDERAQIEAADPVLQAMVARTVEATPEELLRLHGRTRLHEVQR